MSYIRKNIAVLACFLLLAGYAWVFGGIRGEYLLLFVPWLWAFLLEVALCFPQRRAGENSYTARERVWEDVKKDPLAWTALAFFLLLMIPFINNGLCPYCDWRAIAAGANPKPLVKLLPWCVNRLHHLNVVMWFGPSLTLMLAVKHSLNRDGKRELLRLVLWSGTGLALLGYIQMLYEAPGPWWEPIPADKDYFFSTFGYPNMAGDYFTTLFCIAIALWRAQVQHCNDVLKEQKVRRVSKHRLFFLKHGYLIPATLFFLAALTTLSRATILLVSSAAFLLGAHATVSFLYKMKRARRVKFLAWIVLGLIVVAFIVTNFMPKSFDREVGTLSTTAVLDRVSGRGQYHTRVALQLWEDNWLFGCGGWGYKHLCLTKMTPEDLKAIQHVGGINVHNDYVQFLAEHGLVGLLLLVLVTGLLVWPCASTWVKLSKEAAFRKENRVARPYQIFSLPAPCFALLTAAVCTCIHSFGDCAMRSPAVLSLFLVELACLEGYLPPPALEAEEAAREHHHIRTAPMS